MCVCACVALDKFQKHHKPLTLRTRHTYTIIFSTIPPYAQQQEITLLLTQSEIPRFRERKIKSFGEIIDYPFAKLSAETNLSDTIIYQMRLK